MAAHREWTERHIRELVQSELKKLKPASGLTGVQTAIDNFEVGDFGRGRILWDFHMSDEVIHIYPDVIEKDLEYKSFYYELRYKSPTYYDGNLVFGVMPCNGKRANFPGVDIPIYNGLEPVERPFPLEFDSYGAVYGTMYAYQDGKFFSIRTEYDNLFPGSVLSYSQGAALFLGVNPQDWEPNWGIEESEWNTKFSNWSEYDFSKGRHYLYMEFGYKKEV